MWLRLRRSGWRARSTCGSSSGTPAPSRERRAGPNSMTYRLDFRLVKASNFAEGFSPGEIAILSLPARVGGPGFTFIHDKRDNPLESTKGSYFTLDAFAASELLRLGGGLRPRSWRRIRPITRLAERAKRWTSVRVCPLDQHRPAAAVSGHQSPAAGRLCPPIHTRTSPSAQGITTDPPARTILCRGRQLSSRIRVKSGRTPRSGSGFPVGGTALFVNNLELRLPPLTLPYLGEGFGFAIFHDMGNVFTAPHDMLKGLLRWHQADPPAVLVQWYNDHPVLTALQ